MQLGRDATAVKHIQGRSPTICRRHRPTVQYSTHSVCAAPQSILEEEEERRKSSDVVVATQQSKKLTNIYRAEASTVDD